MRVSDRTLYYNAKDAAATRVIFDAVNSDLQKLDLTAPYDHTLSLFGPLSYMMVRGVRVDKDALNELKKKVEVTLVEYQEKLNKLCGRELKFGSSQDCQRYFYGEKGIAPYTKRGAKGSTSVTCDDKALQRLAKGTASRPGLPEARIIQRMRQLQKLKGTYLDIVFDADGRLRCSYNPRGTRFGRLSSSKTIFQTGMNMQNLPPTFQKFLVADPGRVLMKFDKRQAEWVVVAYASGDEAMIHAVETGLDVHAYTAHRMFDVPMDIVKKEHKVVEHETDPVEIERLRSQLDYLKPYLDRWLPRTTSLRQCGKKSNHALNYDETARMFSFINEITEKEANTIIDFYHRAYPGIRTWHDYIRRKLSTDRSLENAFGRAYHFLERWGSDLFKSAYSYIPQSTVGELVNRGMVEIYNDNSIWTNQLEILQQVHDDIKFQLPYNNVAQMVQCIHRIKHALNPTMHLNGRDFTIATDASIGFCMGEMEEIDINSTDAILTEQIETYLREHEQKAVI